MSNSETLNLSDAVLPVVKVHATAVFSILHSYMRRGCNRKVVGSLLGSSKDNVVEIFDCYEVPCLENVEEMKVTIDNDYQKKMYEFHRKINKREVTVGWFTTTTIDGAFITDTASLINDFYSKQCKNPVVLVVDTSLINSDQFVIRGFVAKSLRMQKDEDTFANMFSEVKVIAELSEGESSLVYHMINCQDAIKPWSSGEVVSYLPTEQERITHSLENLLSLVDNLLSYVDNVCAGSAGLPMVEIGMSIFDALGALQTVSADELHNLYRDKVQDLLLVSYMSTLAKTQIQLTGKLHALL